MQNTIFKEDFTERMQAEVQTIVEKGIQKARKDAELDKRVLDQQGIAKYFSVSPSTIRQWEKLGLPFGSMGAQSKFYDKEECRIWVLSQNR